MRPDIKKTTATQRTTLEFTEESMTVAMNKKNYRNCCLYIGHQDMATFDASALMDAYVVADDFQSAHDLIDKAIHSGLRQPDLIVIDIPFNLLALATFIRYKNEQSWAKHIPIVYNEEILAEDQVKLLSSLQLVDDIVHLTQHGESLADKATFLRNTKLFLDQVAQNKVPPISLDDLRKKTSYGLNYFVKRTIDVSLASLAFLLFLPLMVIIYIAIKLESKGPAIYLSKRAGKGFKIFNFYKFRTMVKDADQKLKELEEAGINMYANENDGNPAFFKVQNDPRITRIGSFLRNTSLDELPQLINVIKGDMSIVGNRPLPLYEANSLTTDEWAERFMAPAGITGLWQVKKRGNAEMSAEERIDLDIDYARNHNIAKDFWILAKTPSALFQKANV